MNLKIITDDQREVYNQKITHIIQSWEWGEFRKLLGTPVLRYGVYENNILSHPFQLTLHKVPFLNSSVGYLGKGPFPNKVLAMALKEIGQENNCIAIKVEPDFLSSTNYPEIIDQAFQATSQTHFAQYNFILDLTPTEEVILSKMHSKTRYNIKVAQKHGVCVEERTDDEAFKIYLKLYFETAKKQGYFGHNLDYHQKNWQIFKNAGMARILIAFYTTPSGQKIPLSVWMLHNFHDTLYYFYGGSSEEYKNVMAPTLLAWEAICLGKKLKLKTFDLGGGLPPGASLNHSWQGFHRFKENLGANLVKYMGAYDLIFNPLIYHLFNLADKSTNLKAFLLKIVQKF